MRRIRQDLDWLTSAGLLVVSAATILTGIVSDIWDIRTFIPHVTMGYVMTVLAVAHVVLNWGRLVSYARFRWARFREPSPLPAPTRPARPARPGDEAERPPSGLGRLGRLVSRRGFVGLGVGALAGLLVGRGLKSGPEVAAGDDLGLVYHEWSGPGLGDLFGTVADWGGQPPLYKTYPGAPRVTLPAPAEATSEPFGRLATRRRSIRRYTQRPMSLAQLAAVIEHSAGITERPSGGRLRAAPSCGALYPIETYVAVHRVEGLQPGIYHHAPEQRSLELVREGDVRSQVVDGGLFQAFLGEANAVVLFSGLFQRARWKYHERTYRYALIEAGHYGQNVYLGATALGLGAAAVGAFFDDQINGMLGLDGREEAALYMVAVGNV